MVDFEDKKFIDSMLHGLAFKIYSIGDIARLEGKASQELVHEYETYLGTRAQEIFTMYREASDIERVFLGLRASEALRQYNDELEKEKGKE